MGPARYFFSRSLQVGMAMPGLLAGQFTTGHEDEDEEDDEKKKEEEDLSESLALECCPRSRF